MRLRRTGISPNCKPGFTPFHPGCARCMVRGEAKVGRASARQAALKGDLRETVPLTPLKAARTNTAPLPEEEWFIVVLVSDQTWTQVLNLRPEH